MLYVSIDIETSGLNPDMNNVLSIGAIIEDTTKKLPYEELPKFNAIVIQNNIQGSPRAITMNSNIISMMGEYLEGKDEVRELLNNNSGYKFYTEDEVVKEFYYFLINNGYGDGFILVINGLLFYAVGNWLQGFVVETLVAGLVGALLYSLFSWLLAAIFIEDKKENI